MCQVAVSDFTAADAASGFWLASGESREIIVKEEALVATVEHIVHEFFIELGAEGASGEGLGFATGEHCRSVRARKVVGPAGDRTNLGGLTAVEAQSFVENAATNGVALNLIEVALHHHGFFFAFFLWNGLHKLVESLLELLVAPLLVGASCFCHSVALWIHFGTHTLVEFFVVGLVAIFSLGHAKFGGKLLLSHAHRLDSVVRCLESCDEVVFAHFVHFAFNHHNIVISCTYHQFHVCVFQLFEGWVDDEFASDARHAHFGNGLLKWHVAHSDGSRCCKASECIRLILAVA